MDWMSTGLSNTEHPIDEDAKRAAGHNAQCSILDIVVKAISSHHVPLRFLIASRPESYIKQAFGQQQLSQISRLIELDSDGNKHIYNFKYDHEMMEYLRDGFDKIYDRYSDVMFNVEKPWPSDEDLQELITRSSGQYLYTNTILQFVGSGSDTPVKRLKIILEKRHLPTVNAFLEMDNLYTQILKACPGSRKHLCKILEICVYFHIRPKNKVEKVPQQIAFVELSGLAAEDVIMTFRGLNALLNMKEYLEYSPIPDNISQSFRLCHCSPYVSVRHLSFIEFLEDESRSGEFYVDVDSVGKWLLERADTLISNGLSNRY
jgi:hypothetical protein